MAPSGSLRRTQVAGGGDCRRSRTAAPCGAGLLGVAVGVARRRSGCASAGRSAGVGGGFDGAGGEAGDRCVRRAAGRLPRARTGRRSSRAGRTAQSRTCAVEDRGVEGVAGVQPGPGGRGVTPGLPVAMRSRPCQIPKTAPSRSAASAPRPVCRATGPTATVAPRSRMRAAVTSASLDREVRRPGDRHAGRDGASAPIPATGTPSASATRNSSPSDPGPERPAHRRTVEVESGTRGRGPSGSPSTEPRTRRRSNRRAGADPRWYRHCSVTASRKPSLSGIRHTGT